MDTRKKNDTANINWSIPLFSCFNDGAILSSKFKVQNYLITLLKVFYPDIQNVSD